ncbi:RHS repeat domain-containing protein, partial [Flavobacterium sp. CF136]|uniref:RHS repeat domain-containing protein n=1 Tax=Flavobacterium sp. (strain CF136) TaxID=1144313 RepID=UPI000271C1AE
MKRIHFISYFLLFSYSVFSQEFSKIIPPNPNVASLFKSTITPVNEYSGLPSVSIPLYTVTEGAVSLPISLSYNASGIQVSEESGNVGLGWALNIGGAITRSINGNDDFATSSVGYLKHSQQYPDPVIGSGSYFDPDQHGFVDADSQCKFLVNGNLTSFDQTINPYYQDNDFMPDMFYYNFNGYSGSFVLDRNGNAVLTEKGGLKIFVDTSSGLSQSVKFTITTEDGTIYEFNKTEFTNFSGSGLGTPGYTSSWYLSKITDISGNNINFIYENKGNIVPLRSFTQNFEIDSCADCASPVPQARFKEYAGPYTSIEGIYLSEIQFSNGKVKLNYSADNVRSDLDGYYLESIKVIDNANKIIKQHDFNYTYFGNAGNGNIKSLAQGDYSGSINSGSSEFPHFNLRLRLDSVTEDSIKKHSFEYYHGYNNYVPNKTTLDQDYWGFYNGAGNTRSFIPSVNPNITASQGSSFVAANRVPSEAYAKLFSLEKITYPTKGSTVFEYETNTFDKINLQTVTSRVWQTAKADETTPYTVSVPFTPGKLPFRIEAFFILSGWNKSMSSTKPYVDFSSTFHLRLKKSDGTDLRYYYFPSNEGNQQWNNVQGYAYAGYVYPAEELGTALNPVSGNQFTLEAYFNDRNGLLIGVADIKASWETTYQNIQSYYSQGGGLRVKSISDYDSDGSLETKRAFNYHYQSTVDGQVVQMSYGKLKTKMPRYERIHRFTYTGSGSNQVRNPLIVGSSNSINAFSKDAGSYVGYDQVETIYEGANVDNGKQIKKFYNTEDLFRTYNPVSYVDDYYQFPPVRVPHNGLNYLTQNYKRAGSTYDPVSEIQNDYSINGFSASNFDLNKLYQNPNYVIGAKKENYSLVVDNYYDCSYFKFQLHPYYSNLTQQTATKETLYDTNGQNPVVNEQKFYYDNAIHLQKTRIEATNSVGEVLETKIYYPDDISSTASLAEGGNLISSEYAQIDRLKTHDLHRIATPVQTVTKKNGQITSIQRNLFKTDQGIVLPSSVKTAKGSNSLEDRLVYNDYDNKGNPLEVSKKDGVHIVYVWGYNKTQPIAKIENTTNMQVAAALGVSSVSALNETNLIAINALRGNTSFANSMITTYTYIPLVGVSTITDPKGETITYTYDTAGRLEFVKDKNG